MKIKFLNSLVFKISFFVSLLILISLTIISSVFIYSERQKVLSDIVSNGKTFSSFSTNKIYDDYVQYYTHPNPEDFDNFKNLTQDILKNNSDVVGVSLIAYNGRILFDSEEFKTGKSALARDVTDSKLLEMIKSEETTSSNIVVDGIGEVTAIVVPLPETSGSHILSMRYYISNQSLNQRMNEVYSQILMTVIPLLVLIVMITIPFTIVLTKPIINLTKVANKIQEGDLTSVADISSKGEIGELANTFNGMVKELRESSIKLTASITSLTVGYVMVDKDNNISVINKAAGNILCGFSSSSGETDLTKCTLSEMDKRLNGILDLTSLVNQCIRTKKSFLVKELEIEGRFLKLYITPIIESSETIGAVILVDDITEAKVMERSKDEFFSIASHELRTPLTAIRGNMSMVLEYYKTKIKDPELKLMITDTHDASLRLIGIVNDFLDLSRLEQGKMAYKMSKVNLKEVIDSVVLEMETTVKEKGIKLTAEIDKSVIVNADSDKLKQVLFNIVGNSVKFTEKGGVDITAKINGKFVTLEIKDTGMGISLTNQALLFHKFQQAGSSILTRDGAKGTGLGLYISKLLVEGMGGKIALQSSVEGKGSVFTIDLRV